MRVQRKCGFRKVIALRIHDERESSNCFFSGPLRDKGTLELPKIRHYALACELNEQPRGAEVDLTASADCIRATKRHPCEPRQELNSCA